MTGKVLVFLSLFPSCLIQYIVQKQWATSVGNVLPTIRSSQGHLPVTADVTDAPRLLSRLEQGHI